MNAGTRRLLGVASVLFAAQACGAPPAVVVAPPEPVTAALATFPVEEHLDLSNEDELVHFDFDVDAGRPGAPLHLTDAAGHEIPSQIADRRDTGSRVAGSAWAVVSLAPRQALTLELHTGEGHASPGVTLTESPGQIVLANDRLTVRLPRLPGSFPAPVPLAQVEAPLRSVGVPGGPWLGDARWVDEGEGLRVSAATTRLVEQGPLRVVVEQSVTFEGGKHYRARITLAARQDAALVVEDADLNAPKAAIRLSMEPGLRADHVFWQNQWKPSARATYWELVNAAVPFDKATDQLFSMRPWSFWWLPEVTPWAGFYRADHEALVGILLLRPSRWSPPGWGGGDRTAVPVTARRGGGVDLGFALVSEPKEDLHREWAITAGTTRDHLTKDAPHARLRRQLVKYSEFPLDELLRYGFDFTPAPSALQHPRLLVTPADVARVRREAQTDPAVKSVVDAAVTYLNGCGGPQLGRESPAVLYKHYIGNQLIGAIPEAYLGSPDPLYGHLLAGVIEGLADEVVDTFVGSPPRPAVGAFGPWYTDVITRLVLNYDLIAGSGLLTPAAERKARAAMVLGAHLLAHPDYWNMERGLVSANHNMTAAIIVPRGLLGLALTGHPEADRWSRDAEALVETELSTWISPGGAWVESPYYQTASLDTLLLLFQAIRNVTGHDYFADPRFKSTMDYFGSLLAPPDRRLREGRGAMALPTVGNGQVGPQSSYNGWMAAATARTDPEFSARQQFFWKAQGYSHAYAGRGRGFTLALTDPELPSAPPRELTRAFPGFGSVMRTSWTSPLASYVVHRTGPIAGHYELDQGSFGYYAKGAPLCVPFGHFSDQTTRSPWFFNALTFEGPGATQIFGGVGELTAVHGLPGFLQLSQGKHHGGGYVQQSTRQLLLVESPDPLGANYLVVRDSARRTAPTQTFFWNLFCLSRGVEIHDSVIHFPGQLGVDLDAHVLSPEHPRIQTDHHAWKAEVAIWGAFAEEQYGVHLERGGDGPDFLVVLDPRVEGQAAAEVTPWAGGAGAVVRHGDETDHLLISPGRPTEQSAGPVKLAGEVAFARTGRSGALRLAVMVGERALSAASGWSVQSSGPAAIAVAGRSVTGVASGPAHAVRLGLPPGYGRVSLTLDGAPAESRREGDTLTFDAPEGTHAFALRR